MNFYWLVTADFNPCQECSLLMFACSSRSCFHSLHLSNVPITEVAFTVCAQAVKGCIWLFEQEQALGFSSVSTNIRMTVIKLKSGGLWVHAPIAPTKECIEVKSCFLIIHLLGLSNHMFRLLPFLSLFMKTSGFLKVFCFVRGEKTWMRCIFS